MPLAGARFLGVAIAVALPQPLRSLIAWPSIALALTGDGAPAGCSPLRQVRLDPAVTGCGDSRPARSRSRSRCAAGPPRRWRPFAVLPPSAESPRDGE